MTAVPRIIGGVAGGRRLQAPSGTATRPTSDRVREALFSALESSLGTLVGHSFLDLYAGSGAIALEAASRGAGPVLAVDSDRRTARLIESNAASIGLTVDVTAQQVAKVLAGPGSMLFDVVFADPPYPMPAAEVASALALLTGNGWLAPAGTVVVERSTRSVEPEWPDGLVRARAKEYGETVLWYLRAGSGEG